MIIGTNIFLASAKVIEFEVITLWSQILWYQASGCHLHDSVRLGVAYTTRA